MSTLINISSVPAEKLADGQQQIIARWKDTANRPISAANRVRSVILPANIWSDETTISHAESSVAAALKLHLLDSLAELAKSYLSTIVEESNWQRTQVPQEHFSLASLLNWQNEVAALSGRLNGEEITNWLSSSVTIKAVVASHGAAIGTALGAQLVRLASPNHGLTPEKAGKLLSSLWQAEDADSTTGLRVQLRLTAISKKNDNSQNVLDSIL